MRPTPLSLAALLALAPLMMGAAPRTPPTQVLHVHVEFSFGGHGTTFKDEDLFVNSSRLVTSVVVTNQTASPYSQYWVPETSSRVAKPRPFAELLESLAANQVESQTGNCTVGVHIAPTSGTYELTWYNGSRRGSFSVDIGSITTCPPEIPRIINSINTFAVKSGARGFGIPVDP